MEIFIIILLLILLFIDGFTLYATLTKREGKIVKEPKPKLTREEKDKQERIKNAFDNLMNYDESIARQIRK